jgi:hypothetical protein
LQKLAAEQPSPSPTPFQLYLPDNCAVCGDIVKDKIDILVGKFFVEVSFVKTLVEGFNGLVRELEASNQIEAFPKSCLFHGRIALYISQREVSVKSLVVSLFSQFQSSQVFIFFRFVSESNLDCPGIAILGTHYPHFNILSCIFIEDLKR